MLVTSYDSFTVIVSILVAMLASFTALDMAGRVASSTGKVALVWLFGGGFAMGVGIWAMHFIGMLSMSLDMVMSYDPMLTVTSMVVAVLASVFALWLVCSTPTLPWPRLCGGALVLGSG
ncbi:MHYT domain-containing protein, partial [Pantoea sp. CTOTU49201]